MVSLVLTSGFQNALYPTDNAVVFPYDLRLFCNLHCLQKLPGFGLKTCNSRLVLVKTRMERHEHFLLFLKIYFLQGFQNIMIRPSCGEQQIHLAWLYASLYLRFHGISICIMSGREKRSCCTRSGTGIKRAKTYVLLQKVVIKITNQSLLANEWNATYTPSGQGVISDKLIAAKTKEW